MSLILLTNLFWSFFKIGLFSFGGGYAMIPLMQSEIIVRHGWLTAQELINIIAISETSPGPISIKAATYVGFTLSGITGSVVATIGVISPSLIIVLTLGTFLMNVTGDPRTGRIMQGLRLAVIVLILSAAVSLGKTALVDWTTAAIAAALFIVSIAIRGNPFYLIIAGAILGLIFYPY